MKYTRLFLILILFISATIGVSADVALNRQLARCAELGNKQKRLACYDKLAREVSSNSGPSARLDFIQPPAGFFDSHLVAVPWKEEYKLTVGNFVKLISHAVMDSGNRVTVQGWQMDDHDYVLNITMRTPVKLHFLPRDSASGSSQMSLLRSVTMDGQTIAAGQFIMIIAAMESDEDESIENTKTQSIPTSH